MSSLPQGILLDLDDTILDDSSTIDRCWREACVEHAAGLSSDPLLVMEAIRRTSQWYWADPDRHREGRLALDAARREVVRLALDELGIADVALADGIGGAYARLRDEGMEPLPEAVDTVRWLKSRGCALALLTNGAGPAQRRKIARFGLEGFFDAILVEGEVGFGKPDRRTYEVALARLDIQARDAWMVGDNLEWDVAAPQRLGIFAIWVDRKGKGPPPGSTVRPDRIVRGLSDLRSL